MPAYKSNYDKCNHSLTLRIYVVNQFEKSYLEYPIKLNNVEILLEFMELPQMHGGILLELYGMSLLPVARREWLRALLSRSNFVCLPQGNRLVWPERKVTQRWRCWKH